MFPLAVWIALSVSSSACLGLVILKIDFPEKWTWALGCAVLTGYSVAAALYESGGTYSLLLPFLIPAKVAVQTTGTLALCVGAYSFIVGADKISPHWYALPTGSAPLALVYQYIPAHVVQTSVLCITCTFALYQKSPLAPPLCAILACVVAVDFFQLQNLVEFITLTAEMITVGSVVVNTGVMLSIITSKPSWKSKWTKFIKSR